MEETGKVSFIQRIKNFISRIFVGIFKIMLLGLALVVPGGADNLEKIKILTDGFKNLKKWSIKNIFTSEVVGIALGVSIFLALVLFITPFFFNNSALKFQISQRISQISGLDLTINGDVRVALIPYPSITAEDVVLQNYKPKFFDADKGTAPERVYNIYARSVKVTFPIIATSSNVLIKKISFRNVIAESYDFTRQPLNRQNRFTEIVSSLKKDSPQEKSTSLEEGLSAKLFSVENVSASHLKIINIPKIDVENAELIIYDRLARTSSIKNISFKTDINKDRIYSSGSFTREEISSNFKLAAKFFSQLGKQTSFLEIISPAMELRIKGDFTTENRGIFDTDFAGIFEANIFELKSFYRSYITPNGIIANKLKYNSSPIKISGAIENKAREISLSTLGINSSLVNGSGDIDINFADKIPIIDIDLNLENLDLDSTWSKDPVSLGALDEKEEEEPLSNDEAEVVPAKPAETTVANQQVEVVTPDQPKPEEKIQPIDFKVVEKIRNFDLTSEIKIKSIKYLDAEVKDTNLYLTVSKDGKILVLPLIFTMPGDAIFRVNGALDTDRQDPKFVGKFDAAGKNLKDVLKWLRIESQNLKFDSLRDFNLYSDILLLPNIITLNNFYLNLNNDKSEFLGNLKVDNSNKIPIIVSDFEISDFNIEEYFLTSGQNAYLSPGLLVKKLLWLNDISSNNDLNLHFNKMSYKGEEFPDQSLKLRFGRGYLEIADLKLQSQEATLTANLIMDISGQNPRFDLTASADNFHYQTEQRSKLITQNNLSEAEIKKIKKRNFLDQFFALPSLEGFGGKVVLTFDNLWLDDLKITNFRLAGKLKDGNIENSELTCVLYDNSPLVYKGLIGIRLNKILNGNVSFSDVSLQQFLSDLLGVENISGIANITASVSGSGSTKEDFAGNVVSEIKFNANSPMLEGYGLNDLIRKMFAVQSNAADLREPEKILLNPQSRTIFNQANGTIQLNGDKEGRLRINVSAPAVNGILSGTIAPGNSQFEALFNAIFLTGTRQRQTPINIATSLKGRPDKFAYSMNVDQVRQYLGLTKKKPVEGGEVPPAQTAEPLVVPDQTAITNPANTAQTQNQQVAPTNSVPPAAVQIPNPAEAQAQNPQPAANPNQAPVPAPVQAEPEQSQTQEAQ